MKKEETKGLIPFSYAENCIFRHLLKNKTPQTFDLQGFNDF